MKQIAILAIAFMLVPTALAHAGAPGPSHETRLLHDDNDDTVTVHWVQGAGVIDNIALDAREVYSFVYGEPLLVFKLLLNTACEIGFDGNNLPVMVSECGTLTETIQFTAGGQDHEISVSTEDMGATWTGAVDFLTQPTGVNDGARYYIEAGVRFSTLGIQAGDKISNIFVAQDNGNGGGDNMPQGLIDGSPEIWIPTDFARFNIGEYTVRAPDYYADVALDGDISNIELAADEMATYTLTVTNPTELDQDYAVIGVGTNGLHAIVSDGVTSGSAVNIALQAGESKDIEVAAHNMASEAGMGDWTIIVASSLGGYNELMGMAHLEAAGCPDHGESMEAMEGESMEGMEHGHGAHGCDEHSLEDHDDSDEHHADGHDHEDEGHTHDDEKEDTPFIGVLGILALLGAVVMRRK